MLLLVVVALFAGLDGNGLPYLRVPENDAFKNRLISSVEWTIDKEARVRGGWLANQACLTTSRTGVPALDRIFAR